MINVTGVLESTDNMKRIDILAKYGHLIKHYGTGKDSTIISVFQTKQSKVVHFVGKRKPKKK